MTEYGRGYGSEPWHPEDPLYGDQGPYGGQAQQPQWGGQQPAPQQPAPQQYRDPQQHPQQQYNGGWDGSQTGQLPYDPYDPYGQSQPQADPYAGAGQDPYGHQGGYQQQPHHQQEPHHQQHMQQQVAPHPQQMAPQQQYPPHQYEQPVEPPYEDPADDWRAEPEPPREPEPGHAFFADDEDDHPGPDDEPRERRGKRNGKKNKRRSGTTCLVATLVFAGAVGAVGYFGYDFFMAHFGSAPDYEGEGSGAVQVDIPDGSPISNMGEILAKNGVIKSAGAFNEAAGENKKSGLLQPGTYSLRKHMSAAAAMELMLDPKSRNGLTIREGLRAKDIYALIDKKLKLKAGTTKNVAEHDVKNLGLPSWADDNGKIKDPLEGFLYPSTYSVGENAKPAAVLKQMVARASQVYEKYDLEGNARKLNLRSPLQLLTVASLTQAEGKYKHDFVKVARVVYNRLKPDNTETYGLLDFDSTVNYAKSRSTLDTGSVDNLRHFNDAYNTYKFKGLPPGPIGNPGEVAINSAIHPATGNWYYFVSISPEKTLFAATNEEHERNRRIYLKEHGKAEQ
ncbi:endolytic transglycosylase MltG [Streptomyces lydicus]|uniref:endolytic transglycosylase MltG n=1 Tax=Streptomyces lydicus TaxID=47763 RepID=UPI000527B9FA|nr:endolytic transglycosylase MltG [Streptomyces lydicus]MDC7339954.1 endolytic transglycosylase MltG [Streptomyces lydicus]UEG90410.1 endolytic transglycosylase MltG [Streptomyces lydicus]